MENFVPAYEIVKFYLFFEKWRRGEIENSDLYLSNLKAVCRPSGTFVHPSGVEKSLEECVNTFRKCHGDKKGKQYRIWVDQVLPTQVGSDSWLVSFKKWELCGKCLLPRRWSFIFTSSFLVSSDLYAYLTPTSEVERLFPINPRPKGKTIRSNPEQEVTVEQETTDNNKNNRQ
uniref:Sucrose-phosphatase 1 n=1 Tax=Solanum tuberosum TaxID=4113 RepID=M1BX64_SOLTU